MSRTSPQNKCFHKWCEVISKHICDDRQERIDEAYRSGNQELVEFWKECPKLTKDSVKELVLLKMGNTREALGEKIPMRSHNYKMTEAELSPQERKAGYIAMDELLGMMEVWAAMDLGLNLGRDEECAG